MNWKEFKPVIFFLLKFLGIYILGNLIYGLFVTAYEPNVDPATLFVTKQTASLLNLLNYNAEANPIPLKNIADLVVNNKSVLAVYEGCNGINVWIIFVGFMFAFSKPKANFFIFLVIGSVLIHLSNLIRISLLFFVSRYLPEYWYFSHKYLFTAFLYAVVFLLWFIWIRKSKHVESKA